MSKSQPHDAVVGGNGLKVETSYRSLNSGGTEFCLDYRTKYIMGQDSGIINIQPTISTSPFPWVPVEAVLHVIAQCLSRRWL